MFAYQVRDPERYGVVEFDADGRAVSLEEKPAEAAVVVRGDGPLLLRRPVVDVAAGLKPSPPGRARDHRRQPRLPGAAASCTCEMLGRGVAWLDTGTHDSLLQASNFIQAIEERQGLKVACLEEIAYRMGYIGTAEVREIALR